MLREHAVSEAHRNRVWRTKHGGADVQAFYDTLSSGVVIPVQVALAVPSSPDPITSRFSAVRIPSNPLARAQNPALGCPAAFLREQPEVAVMEGLRSCGALLTRDNIPPDAPHGSRRKQHQLEATRRYDAWVLKLLQAPGEIGYPRIPGLSPGVTPTHFSG